MLVDIGSSKILNIFIGLLVELMIKLAKMLLRLDLAAPEADGVQLAVEVKKVKATVQLEAEAAHQ